MAEFVKFTLDDGSEVFFEWQVELTGESSKWNVVLEQRPQLLKPSQGCRALVFRQCGQEWRLRRCHALGAHRIRTHLTVNIC